MRIITFPTSIDDLGLALPMTERNGAAKKFTPVSVEDVAYSVTAIEKLLGVTASTDTGTHEGRLSTIETWKAGIVTSLYGSCTPNTTPLFNGLALVDSALSWDGAIAKFGSDVQLSGNAQLRSSIQIRNKADSAWLSFATRNTSGADTVIDFTNVGSIGAGSVSVSGLTVGGATISGSGGGSVSIGASGLTVNTGVLTAAGTSVINRSTDGISFLLTNSAAAASNRYLNVFAARFNNSTPALVTYGQITIVTGTTTAGAETGIMTLDVIDAGSITTGLTLRATSAIFNGSLKSAGAFGANNATPQTQYASGGAAPAGGTGTAAGGYDTAAHRDSLITLVNNIRTALVNNGIMS